MRVKLKFRSVLVSAALLLIGAHWGLAATGDLTSVLQKGLFEEEANHNLNGAIQAYQSVITQFDKDRKLAATAIYRLGECYRKQGNTNEAMAQYQRLLNEFADQTPLIGPTRQNVALLRGTPARPAAPALSEGTGSGRTTLLTAAEMEELKRVESTIQHSPDLINAPDAQGQTLLERYCAKGNLAVVRLLLEHGAAVNGIQRPNLTPLHYAAGNGHKSVVEFLLSKGAKPDLVTETGVMPLHLAVQKGYEQVAKLLLEAGAPVNAKISSQVNRSGPDLSYAFAPGMAPLQTACLNGYPSLVDLLIRNGAEVNTEPVAGNTPLTAAISRTDVAMVETLLAAKANVSNPALRSAAGKGDIPILKLLLERVPNLETNVPSPLIDAISQKQPEVVKLLIQHRADPNTKDDNGYPVSFRALGDAPTLHAVLQGGANPDSRSPEGDTLLGLAAGGGYETLDVLLDGGADIEARNTDGLTALHLAIARGRKAQAELLLRRGAKVSTQADDGRTPLHIAIRNGYQELAALLLNNKADPNIRDASGMTPLDLAKEFLRRTPGMPLAPQIPAPLANISSPSSSSPAKATAAPLSMVDLLRQHGAIGDLPHMDRLEVIRRSANYSSAVLMRGTNNLNRFSLLEVIAAHYGFVTGLNVAGNTGRNLNPSSHTVNGALEFPNLEKILIRRAKPDGSGWQGETSVSLEAILLQSADCSKDLWLQWGDQVEIPEADHPLGGVWTGFDPELLKRWSRCLARQVQVIVKGQTNILELNIEAPLKEHYSQRTMPPDFCLKPALLASRFLLASSDLSQVRLKRRDPVTGQNWELVLDCSTPSQPRGNVFPREADIWLRNGDIIEVPEKP